MLTAISLWLDSTGQCDRLHCQAHLHIRGDFYPAVTYLLLLSLDQGQWNQMVQVGLAYECTLDSSRLRCVLRFNDMAVRVSRSTKTYVCYD